jgi:hypothetical protein
MKNRRLTLHNEQAKIYRNHYKPSVNMVRLVKSVLSIVISGSSVAPAGNYRKR